MTFSARDRDALHSHFEVEGYPFGTVGAVYGAAVKRGYKGSRGVIGQRLHNGINTWDALLAPVPKQKGAIGRKINKIKAKEDMKLLCDQLDARKAQLKDKS